MKKYRRRYKAVSMHKDMKRGLAEKNNSSFDEKKMNKVVADYYYSIQNAWNDRDMDILKQCLSPSLYEQLVLRQEKVPVKLKFLYYLNCKMKLELRNWDKGACPFIPIRAAAGPLFSIFL